MKYPVFVLLTAIVLSSCWGFGNRPAYRPKKVLGYVPVYSSDSSLLTAVAMTPQPFRFPGKIYVKDNFIFQNDIGYGIHIIDNADPSQPKQVGFIKLPGSSEISIKGNYLYSNSFTDLVVIDVNDRQHITEVKRIHNAFQQGSVAAYNFIPLPEHNVHYECAYSYIQAGDNGIRIQTGWARDSVYNNSCYYP